MTAKQIATGDASAAPPAQSGLRISHPGDRWEREADRTAEQVLRTPPGPLTASLTDGLTRTRGWSGIQRCPGGCPGEDESDMMMRSVAAGAMRTPDVTPGDATPAAVTDAGRPLSRDVRRYFEPRFGHDFSRVRVHDSSAAGTAAAGLRARAFTLGSDVVFGSGTYRPQSQPGRWLLAHELAHVVQQGHARRLEPGS